MSTAANRRIVFRADASLQMGTGHVMRCLTLADTLAAAGVDCHFICREHPGNLAAFIRQRGYPVHLLALSAIPEQVNPTVHAAWLGAGIAQDAEDTAVLLSHLQPDWLIIDHYALDIRWETPQRLHAAKLMVIDDLADRQHDCDLLLDQNLGRTDTDYAAFIPPHCTTLIGPGYALLRPEFSMLRPYSLQRRQTGALQSLLITMGGVDKDNVTGRILKVLRHSCLPDNCRITVVMGATAPWLQEVTTLAATLPWPVTVQVNVSDMARLMADADLAIGAAGSTSWERCCLGLPTLMAVLADNQREAASYIEKSGAAKQFYIHEQLPGQLAALLCSCRNESSFLHDMSQSGRHITDGTGVKRVAAKLLKI